MTTTSSIGKTMVEGRKAQDNSPLYCVAEKLSEVNVYFRGYDKSQQHALELARSREESNLKQRYAL
jgi:hypothetical protein